MDPSKLTPEMLSHYPAMQPPDGMRSNFGNPGIDGSNARQTIVVTAVLTGITIAVLALRLYSKVFVVKSPGWDDCE